MRGSSLPRRRSLPRPGCRMGVDAPIVFDELGNVKAELRVMLSPANAIRFRVGDRELDASTTGVVRKSVHLAG
jgi:hypothetical protein